MITPHNLILHELIGLQTRVLESRNTANKNVSGVVIDETQKTLIMTCRGKEKRIFKKATVFQFQLSSGERVNVNGELLYGRPWDRIKRRLPK